MKVQHEGASAALRPLAADIRIQMSILFNNFSFFYLFLLYKKFLDRYFFLWYYIIPKYNKN